MECLHANHFSMELFLGHPSLYNLLDKSTQVPKFRKELS